MVINEYTPTIPTPTLIPTQSPSPTQTDAPTLEPTPSAEVGLTAQVLVSPEPAMTAEIVSAPDATASPEIVPFTEGGSPRAYTPTPQDRLRDSANNASLPDRTLGLALFADISGFMALTESLRERFTRQNLMDEQAFKSCVIGQLPGLEK